MEDLAKTKSLLDQLNVGIIQYLGISRFLFNLKFIEDFSPIQSSNPFCLNCWSDTDGLGLTQWTIFTFIKVISLCEVNLGIIGVTHCLSSITLQSFGVFRVTCVFQFSRVYVIIVHYMIPPCWKQCYSHQQKEFC